MDVSSMVEAYLDNKSVVLKNKDKLDFTTSIRVFVDRRQTPVPSIPKANTDDPGTLTVEKVKARFAEALLLYKQKKNEKEMARLANKRYSSPQCLCSHHKHQILQPTLILVPFETSSLSDRPDQRHKSSQRFNRYRTIDQPPPKDEDDTTDATKEESTTPIHRPRYSIKTRTQKIKHEPPPAMKQNSFKPYTKQPESPIDNADNTDINSPNQSNRRASRRYAEPTSKVELLRALAREHPLVSLTVGDLYANVKGALKVTTGPWDGVGPGDEARSVEDATSMENAGSMEVQNAAWTDNTAVAQAVVGCVRKAVREACRVKRKAQGLIGVYIERVMSGDVTAADRRFLDFFCPHVQPKESNSARIDNQSQDNSIIDDDNHQQDNQEKFLACLMRHLYSGNSPTGRGISTDVAAFIKRLDTMNLYHARSTFIVNQKMEFSPSELVRSVSAQLSVELKKMYKNGSQELQAQVIRIPQAAPKALCILIINVNSF
jgi:hypothetical protein